MSKFCLFVLIFFLVSTNGVLATNEVKFNLEKMELNYGEDRFEIFYHEDNFDKLELVLNDKKIDFNDNEISLDGLDELDEYPVFEVVINGYKNNIVADQLTASIILVPDNDSFTTSHIQSLDAMKIFWYEHKDAIDFHVSINENQVATTDENSYFIPKSESVDSYSVQANIDTELDVEGGDGGETIIFHTPIDHRSSLLSVTTQSGSTNSRLRVRSILLANNGSPSINQGYVKSPVDSRWFSTDKTTSITANSGTSRLQHDVLVTWSMSGLPTLSQSRSVGRTYRYSYSNGVYTLQDSRIASTGGMGYNTISRTNNHAAFNMYGDVGNPYAITTSIKYSLRADIYRNNSTSLRGSHTLFPSFGIYRNNNSVGFSRLYTYNQGTRPITDITRQTSFSR
ncbi:hypothetical protein BpOF4_21984 (plasmid) [Alkalihalophilus pseudofirmus OF4]|uniref:Uncharacterized protein n=1 Tax=Alkalihalophilus pseudofirmus (strain ATCC BAA-2126 / JCM 17055 / OF4) TaxID=398511 RepID=D3G216_ALKPO|nr:hypothetical protein BpOF4_21984 [Alkalihalophilus pseudofirmus OF4]